MNIRRRLESGICVSGKTRFVRLGDLKPHEEVDSSRVARLMSQIEKDGILKLAVAVDIRSGVILDGHHRLAALRKIGCKRIPVTFVDYSSQLIRVMPWNGMTLVKSEVIRAGITGRLYPPKTSKHLVRLGHKIEHISAIEERVNVPLRLLKRA